MTQPMHLHENIPIDSKKTLLLAYKAMNYPILSQAYQIAKECGWQIVVKDINRGFCNNSESLIIIPVWAFKHKNPEFCIYYLAHELAHTERYGIHHTKHHGIEWRAEFIRLCPRHLVKFDLDYRLGRNKHVNI